MEKTVFYPDIFYPRAVSVSLNLALQVRFLGIPHTETSSIMLSSCFSSLIKSQLDNIFSNVEAAQLQASHRKKEELSSFSSKREKRRKISLPSASSIAVSLEGLQLRERSFEKGPLRITINGTVKKLLIDAVLPFNPLLLSSAHLIVFFRGIELNISIDEIPDASNRSFEEGFHDEKKV